MRYIKIFDTTLRDGEQTPGVCLNSTAKLKIAKQLEKLGVEIIEAGFPISSREGFESVKKISKEVRGATICALARLTKEDIDLAYEATKEAKNSRIHFFIGTSKSHCEKKIEKK